MELNLTPQEAELLARILERAMTDLLREIHHTDRGVFKAALKDDEVVLQGLQAKVRISVPHT